MPGLSAKPIVDILVGLNEFYLSEEEKTELIKIGYEFFGQLHQEQKRYFLRKRGNRNFNIAIVVYKTQDWVDHIVVRDYLRSHPEEVQAYAQIKEQAIAAGATTLFTYHPFKDEYVKKLLERARVWYEEKH